MERKAEGRSSRLLLLLLQKVGKAIVVNEEKNRNRKASEVVKESSIVFPQCNNIHTEISHFQFHREIEKRRRS